MITLTGYVYHEERPVFLCPLYHPCVDEWDPQSINNSIFGWIPLLTYSPSSSLPVLSHSFSSSLTLNQIPCDSEKSNSLSTSDPLSQHQHDQQQQQQPSSSTSFTSSSSSSSSFPHSTGNAKSSSPSSLTFYSPSNGSSIHVQFEFNQWSLVKYNLTLYQLIYVFKQIWRSRFFRKSIVSRELIPKECRRSIRTLLYRGTNIDLFVRFRTFDCHSTPIDFTGNYLFLALVTTKLRIEETLSILSTLGGAYSSLGEHYLHFAIKAGETSIKQIGLACITADPTIIARCAIYMVYSLCQRGLQKRARLFMINFIHPYISKLIIKKTCDNIVRNMYKAAKFRVEYYYNGN